MLKNYMLKNFFFKLRIIYIECKKIGLKYDLKYYKYIIQIKLNNFKISRRKISRIFFYDFNYVLNYTK